MRLFRDKQRHRLPLVRAHLETPSHIECSLGGFGTLYNDPPARKAHGSFCCMLRSRRSAGVWPPCAIETLHLQVQVPPTPNKIRGLLTASYAVELTKRRSQIEQNGCHALELFMCCKSASLLLKGLLSH